jgi:hypothetical protein
MKQTVALNEFRDAFRIYNRMENFTREGLEALFNHLEALEQDTGEEIELDVIALCCDYSQDTYAYMAVNYSIDVSECVDDEETKAMVLDYLEGETMVVAALDDSVVYMVF